jgi:hypothetical protein
MVGDTAADVDAASAGVTAARAASNVSAAASAALDKYDLVLIWAPD